MSKPRVFFAEDLKKAMTQVAEEVESDRGRGMSARESVVVMEEWFTQMRGRGVTILEACELLRAKGIDLPYRTVQRQLKELSRRAGKARGAVSRVTPASSQAETALRPKVPGIPGTFEPEPDSEKL